MAWVHALPDGNGRISVYHAAGLSTLPLRPTCFPRYFLHLSYDWSLCLAPSLLLNGVTSMSFRPGCHRPFHRSACLCSLLLLSWVSLLFIVGFCHSCFCHPRPFASACPHFNRRHSPTLRPVFTQLARTALVEGAGVEPAMSYAFFAAYPRHYPFSGYSSVAFDHLAILPYLVLCLAAKPQGHCVLISLSRPSMMSLLILCFG